VAFWIILAVLLPNATTGHAITCFYHAIENRANQNTGGPLYIRRYYSNARNKIVMRRSLDRGISLLSHVFSWYTHSPKVSCVYRQNSSDSWDIYTDIKKWGWLKRSICEKKRKKTKQKQRQNK